MTQALILHIITLECPKVSSSEVSLNFQGIYNRLNRFLFCEHFPSPLIPSSGPPLASTVWTMGLSPPSIWCCHQHTHRAEGYWREGCVIPQLRVPLTDLQLRVMKTDYSSVKKKKKNTKLKCVLKAHSVISLSTFRPTLSPSSGAFLLHTHTHTRPFSLPWLPAVLSHKFC